MNDYILNLFTGDDELRPALMRPSLEGEFVYATNGYALARINKSALKFKYEKRERFPTIDQMFQVSGKSKIAFYTKDLADVLSKMAYRLARKECEECEGKGDIKCDCCGHENDCEECGGTGVGNEIEFPVKMVFKFGNNIKIGHRQYSPTMLNIMLIGALSAKEDQIMILNDYDDASGGVFSFGDFQVLLMPINGNESYKKLNTINP